MNDSIIILEDKEFVADKYRTLLTEEGYDVRLASNSRDFFELYDRQKPDLILLDIELTGSEMNGLEVFRELKKKNGFTSQVIVVSGEASRQEVAEAMQLGAYSFIEKTGTFNTKKFLLDIHHAIDKKKQKEYVVALETENTRLRRKSAETMPLIGGSDAMNEVRQLIGCFADVDVLLLGETGTGKEVAAHHIRCLSGRFDKPFVSVNCAAIPETLIESELFGHKKGSFTGADKNKQGAFEKSDGGILFLDEIDSLSFRNQGVILKALERKEIQPVGGSVRTVDVQLICATNKDLNLLRKQKMFRDDLFYRLQGNVIFIPPLRQRGDDILELLRHFFDKKSQRKTDDVRFEINFDFIKENMLSYDWPGNVRELERFCEKLINQYTLIDNSVILKELKIKTNPALHDDILDESVHRLFQIGNWKESMDEFEKAFLLYHLNRNRWKVEKTAEAVGLDKTTLYKKINKYQIVE